MKIARDNLGHICQINMDDGSEIPSNEIKTAFETIAEDEKEITAREIAREKEITAREIAKEKEKTNKEEKRCNFFISIAATAAEAIIADVNEYNRQQSLNNNDNLNSESSEEEIH